MKYVELPQGFATEKQKLPFFLAMEEWLARQCSGEQFFMWQVDPTVIFGRNQMAQAEVNIDYCKTEGIEFYRRKSGGGCVFADRSNIMFSHIAPSDSVATTFSAFTGSVAQMLRSLGMDAEATGRNDILIAGRKVSGYAFYHINLPHGSRAIVHGTMLYDADLERMAKALTPSPTKLDAKGVASVRSRVTTVHEHSSISLDDFKNHARKFLCDGTMTLSQADICEIRKMERGYYTDDWIYGRRKNTAQRTLPSQRIDGVGEFRINLILENGTPHGHETPKRIKNIDLTGDFFITADIDAAITRPLAGCTFTREAIERVLSKSGIGQAIHGLTPAAFATMLLNAHPS